MSRTPNRGPRKMRNDSALNGLTLAEKDQVFALYDQCGVKAVEQIQKQMGLKVSAAALSNFYSSWPFRRAFYQASNFADNFKQLLREIPDLKLSPAQLDQTAQAVFEAEAVRQMDRKGFLQMKSARQKDALLAQEDRKIALLEKRAAQAAAAEQVTRENLSPEEKAARYRQIFGIT